MPCVLPLKRKNQIQAEMLNIEAKVAALAFVSSNVNNFLLHMCMIALFSA